MAPITLVPFVKDLMLGSKFKALESSGFRIQAPDWSDPAAGFDPERAVLVVDCNLAAPDPASLILTCRKAHPHLPILGFVSHVDSVSREAAERAGATAVYPRSKFFGQMTALLQAHGPGKSGETRDQF